jgi:hypothetical protein
LGVASRSRATGIRCKVKPSAAQFAAKRATAATAVHGSHVRIGRSTARFRAARKLVA